MRSLLAATSFLTRLPAGRLITFDAADVARSAGWFPLIGATLGAVIGLSGALLRGHLPAAVIAALLVLIDVALTGALHWDGLADSADGFGGGKDRDDVLRIMRDHSIGSYGGVALAVFVALKFACYEALLDGGNWITAAIATPMLGRWAILLLSATLPYARQSASIVDHVGKGSLLWATLITAAILLAIRSDRAWIGAGVVALVTLAFGLYCRHRIGGITGDTLGANVALSESAALLVFLWTA